MNTLHNYYQKLVELKHDKFGANWGTYGQTISETSKICNTLWIPFSSHNRTATLNLNHGIDGFDETGRLHGFNGNCGTGYIIIEVPNWFDLNSLDYLQYKMGGIRRLNANNIEKIEEFIKNMSEDDKTEAYPDPMHMMYSVRDSKGNIIEEWNGEFGEDSVYLTQNDFE
jgi:hypothetical protein